MEMILPLLNLLKDPKNNINRNENLKEEHDSKNLHLIESNVCSENRMNQRNSFYPDFPNFNNTQNSSNIAYNPNNISNSLNPSHIPNMNINNDSMSMLSQILMKSQTNNCNNMLNNFINNNNINKNNNNNVNFNNNNMNSPFNFNNSGVSDFVKASSLITELINLEQQNRIQIDLIQKIISNKSKNNNIINNLLINILSNNGNEGSRDGEKNEDGTTKSSSRSSDESNKNRGYTNTTLNAFEIETIKAAENNSGNSLLSKKTLRDPRQNTACGHMEKKHYAKGMCNNCYHSNGRNKKAWKCSHVQKSHYALGVCQTCYQMKYTTKLKKNLEENNNNNNNNTHSSDHSQVESESKISEKVLKAEASVEEKIGNESEETVKQIEEGVKIEK